MLARYWFRAGWRDVVLEVVLVARRMKFKAEWMDNPRRHPMFSDRTFLVCDWCNGPVEGESAILWYDERRGYGGGTLACGRCLRKQFGIPEGKRPEEVDTDPEWEKKRWQRIKEQGGHI